MHADAQCWLCCGELELVLGSSEKERKRERKMWGAILGCAY